MLEAEEVVLKQTITNNIYRVMLYREIRFRLRISTINLQKTPHDMIKY